MRWLPCQLELGLMRQPLLYEKTGQGKELRKGELDDTAAGAF